MAGDDGLGFRVISLLTEAGVPSNVALELISAPGPEMVELLDAPGEVWFVDAARGHDLRPGEIITRLVGPSDDASLVPSQHLVSTHGLSLAELLKLATALNRRRATVRLFGVVGAKFDPGNTLSSEVESAAHALAQQLLAELRKADAT